MKQILPLILISAIISVFLASCTWVPEGKATKLREKTTIKTFDDVNDPIVFDLMIPETFTFGGKEGNVSNSIYIGSALVVYDWENDKIVDFVYSPELGYCGEQTLSLVKDSNGVCNYYMGSWGLKRLSVLNAASTKLKTIKVFQDKYVQSGISDSVYSDCSNALIYYRKDYSMSEGTLLGVRVVNPDTKDFGPEMTFYTTNNPEASNLFVPDGNGNFWIACEVEFKDEHYRKNTKIFRINTAENKAEEPLVTFDNHKNADYDVMDGWSTHDEYEILYADVTSLILLKTTYVGYIADSSQLLCIDIATETVSEIAKTENASNNYLSKVVKASDKLYEIEEVYTPDTREYFTYIFTINLSEKKLEPQLEGVKSELKRLDSIRVYGNKVFLINANGYYVDMICYDASLNKFGDLKTISVKDLYN